MFDKIRQVNQAAIVDNKHLDAALTMAKLIQEQLPVRKRNNNEPSRLSQPSHLFPAPAATDAPAKRKRGRPPRPCRADRGGAGAGVTGPTADAAGPSSPSHGCASVGSALRCGDGSTQTLLPSTVSFLFGADCDL
jgi:hypothetical protein